MVLQRDMDLPVWGGGKKGDQVAVEFVGVSKTTEVDETGKWMVKLGSFPAGGPHEMKITQGATSPGFKLLKKFLDHFSLFQFISYSK